jgi:hypothetical protein
MKKTIWIPLVIGLVFGLIAGLATIANISFVIPPGGWAIGLYGICLVLAAALGGPLAAVEAELIWLLSGLVAPTTRSLVSIPFVFWTNLIVNGGFFILVAFAYRFIYERWTMPKRLLGWIVILIGYFVLHLPALVLSQFAVAPAFMSSAVAPLTTVEYIMQSYLANIPSFIVDTVVTSLIWFALTERYRKPLWYEAKPAEGK